MAPPDFSTSSSQTDTAENICAVTDVTYAYGPRTALSNVSFKAERGGMVAVLGPSGAGKTTLLRIITGMLVPASGVVTLHGRRLTALPNLAERTKLVGMVQQRLDLVPELSVRHNVDAGMLGRWNLLRSLAGLLLPVRHAGTAESIARVGLVGRESERVSRLSGGEQQRVAFARLLVQDPEVIVADEPIASLDPALADELLTLLRSIASERSRTVIASIHDPQLACRHFDRIVGLRDGAVQFDLHPKDLTPEHLDQLYARGEVRNGQSSPSTTARAPWGI